jgi:bilirubin oxidase
MPAKERTGYFVIQGLATSQDHYSTTPFQHSMKTVLIALFALCLLAPRSSAQSYNTLWIPDTLSGKTFNLTIKDTLKQIIPGNQTITGGINSNFWGPTLFFSKGDTVRMNVLNKLNDSTTLHWHGMHLPAVMDGGPHQIIPPGTLWQPFWKVTNNAGLYWFHPHLHEKTEDQITKGIGGLIIVRDAAESALPLPRKYGVDDIPLVLTDRSFASSNQFSVVPYGDSMMTNGVLRAQYTVPAQVVRFRLLNAAIERSYNIGFSDGRTFYVITTDGGLLNAPVAVTRFLLSAGERVEILVNCTGQAGTTLDMKAYNSTLANAIPGGESFPNGPFASFLGKKDFNILRLNIGAQTSSPITAIPSSLTTNIFPSTSSAALTRSLTLTDSTGVRSVTILGPNAFILNRRLFNIKFIDYQVPLNNTEIWELKSTSGFAHPFHIHDVQFYILTRNGAAAPNYEQGWKDVVLVKSNETVRFIAKFDDYADATHPFMYHCHISLHEDEGMMGQFVVTGTNTAVQDPTAPHPAEFSLMPNPTNDKLYINLPDATTEVYYVTVTNVNGRALLMLPQPDLQNGIDVSSFAPGVYFVQLMDKRTKSVSVRKFIRQ